VHKNGEKQLVLRFEIIGQMNRFVEGRLNKALLNARIEESFLTLTERSVKKIMAPRTEEQYEEIRGGRKASILDAALHVFGEEGYHSASISKISKKAGVSKGLMYNYFDSKEELLKELLDDVFQTIMDSMGIVAGEVITDELLIQHIETSFDVLVENKAHWKLYLSMIMQPIVMEMAMEQMLPKIEPYMMSLMEYFQKKGHEDPMVMVQYYTSTLDGVQMRALFDPENYPIEEVKKLIIKQFIA
jgi:AcrR family transcriptional regulator